MGFGGRFISCAYVAVAAFIPATTTEGIAQSRGYTVLAGEREAGDPPVGATTTSSILQLPSDSRDHTAVGSKAPDAAARPMTDAERHIRAVGPKFLPDPGEASDLRVPDRIHAR